MFTGIVTDLGEVRVVTNAGDTLFEIHTAYKASEIPIGASIACCGVCLTVIERGTDIDSGRNWFAVQASNETLSKTTLGLWKKGSVVNLERALSLGDELGGHLVSGHVDGIAEVVSMKQDGDSIRFVFRASKDLMRFVATKGSVTLDGVSLTVNEVGDDTFGVNIIDHTQKVTTFGIMEVGYKANMEIDLLARYVKRLLETQ